MTTKSQPEGAGLENTRATQTKQKKAEIWEGLGLLDERGEGGKKKERKGEGG